MIIVLSINSLSRYFLFSKKKNSSLATHKKINLDYQNIIIDNKNLSALLKNGFIYYSLLIQNILIKKRSLIV